MPAFPTWEEKKRIKYGKNWLFLRVVSVIQSELMEVDESMGHNRSDAQSSQKRVLV